MKPIIYLTIFFWLINVYTASTVFAQSNFKIDSLTGNKNEYKSNQKQSISDKPSQKRNNSHNMRIKGDGNRIEVNQSIEDASESSNFWSNIDTWLSILASLAGLGLFAFLGKRVWPFIKRIFRVPSIFLICLLGSTINSKNAYAQLEIKNDTQIEFSGNQNIIQITQAKNVIKYDLSKTIEADKFIKYVQSLPYIQERLGHIINNLDEVKKIIKQVKGLIVSNKVFNEKVFVNTITEFIKKNEEKSRELEDLKKKNNGTNFTYILTQAEECLKNYDHKCYQDKLQEFKTNVKGHIYNYAEASYLQATDNISLYKYQEAIDQINESIKYGNGQSKYFITKASILYNTRNYEDVVNMIKPILDTISNELKAKGIYTILGNSYSGLEDYKSSIYYLRESIAFYSDQLDEDSIGKAVSYTSIGLAYNQIGKYDSAIDCYQKALTITPLSLRNQHYGTIYNNIGLTYSDKGHYTLALKNYQTALEFTKNYLGDSHPTYADYLSNIGAAYNDMHDYDMAIKYHRKALKIQLKALRGTNYYTSRTFVGLGVAYLEKNKLDSSFKYLDKAFKLRNTKNNVIKADLAEVYTDLGLLFDRKENSFIAIDNYNKALSIYESRPAIYNQKIGELNQLIGFSYFKIKSNKFIYYTYKSINMIKYTPVRKENLLLSYYILAQDFLNKGNTDSSKKYYLIGLKRFNEIPRDYLKYINSRNKIEKFFLEDIGTIYFCEGKLDSAYYYLNQTSFGTKNERQKELFINETGKHFIMIGQCNNAINILQAALTAINKGSINNDYELLAYSNLNIAMAYCCSGKKKLAYRSFKKAREYAEKWKRPDIVKGIDSQLEKCKISN